MNNIKRYKSASLTMGGAGISRCGPRRPGPPGLVGAAAGGASWRGTPTHAGVWRSLDAIGVAWRTSADGGRVRLDARTPPAHSGTPRVDWGIPPRLGPGQDTPHQRSLPCPPPAPPVRGGG